MPHGFAVAEIAHRLSVLDHVGDDVEFRIRLVERLDVRIRSGPRELAEVSAEGNELRIREVLAVENDDQPLTPCGADGVDVGLRQGLWKGDPPTPRPPQRAP